VSFIDEHDTILVDTGTTMLALAKALVRSELTHITVYSNDLGRDPDAGGKERL
jgi:DeoR/GlpR family transcriptional regulator of sugar metabolism